MTWDSSFQCHPVAFQRWWSQRPRKEQEKTFCNWSLLWPSLVSPRTRRGRRSRNLCLDLLETTWRWGRRLFWEEALLKWRRNSNSGRGSGKKPKQLLWPCNSNAVKKSIYFWYFQKKYIYTYDWMTACYDNITPPWEAFKHPFSAFWTHSILREPLKQYFCWVKNRIGQYGLGSLQAVSELAYS